MAESEMGEGRPGMRLGARRLLPALLLLGAACAVSWLHQDFYDFQHDDAYISYRYARNWAVGSGPVYNAGERVEGYSNFLMVAALACVRTAGGDIVSAARAMGTLSCWLLMANLFYFLTAVLGRSVWIGVAGALALALHAGIACWARSGLETLPFACAVLGSQTVFLWELRREKRPWRSGFLFGVVALLRADGFLYVLITALFLALLRRPRHVAWLLLGFGTLFAPYFFWRFQYYGYPFPNSFYVRSGGLPPLLRGLFYTNNFVSSFGGILLFALPFWLWVRRDPARDHFRLYLGLTILLQSAYVVGMGGDHMPMFRFFMPLVAPLTLLLFESVLEIVPRLAGPAVTRWATPATIGVVVLSGFMPTLNQRRLPYTHAISNRTFATQWSIAGDWLRAHIPPGTLLATQVAGAVAYRSDLPVVDMLGVNDVHIAHVEVRGMGRGSAAHEKSDLPYVLSRQPGIIFKGVRDSACSEGEVRSYEDGSRYVLQCAALGPGPQAGEFGEVEVKPLYLWYEKRVGPEPASR